MSDFANKKSLFCLRSPRSQPLKNKLMEKSTVTPLEAIQTSPVSRHAPSINRILPSKEYFEHFRPERLVRDKLLKMQGVARAEQLFYKDLGKLPSERLTELPEASSSQEDKSILVLYP